MDISRRRRIVERTVRAAGKAEEQVMDPEEAAALEELMKYLLSLQVLTYYVG